MGVNFNAGSIFLECNETGQRFELGDVPTLETEGFVVHDDTGAAVHHMTDHSFTFAAVIRLTRRQKRALYRLAYGFPKIDKPRRRNARKAWRLLYYNDIFLWWEHWNRPGVWKV